MEMVSGSVDVFELEGRNSIMKRSFVKNDGDSVQMYKKPKVSVVRSFPKGCGGSTSLGKVKVKGLVKKGKIKVKRDVLVESRGEELRVSALRMFQIGCGQSATLENVGTLDVEAEKDSFLEKDFKQLGISNEQEILEKSGCYALDDAIQTEFISGNDSDVKGKGSLLVEDNSFGEQEVVTVVGISGQYVLDNVEKMENSSGNESSVKRKQSLVVEDDSVRKEEIFSISAVSGQHPFIDATQTENTSGCESDIKGKESLFVEDVSVKKDEVLTTPVISGQYLSIDAKRIKDTSGSVSDSKGKKTLLAEDESVKKVISRPDALGQHGMRGPDSTEHPRISFSCEAVEVVKNVVLEESSQSMKDLEFKDEKASLVEHGSVKNIKHPAMQTLPEDCHYYVSGDGGVTVSSLDRLRTKPLAAPASSDSADQTEVSSTNLGLTELFHTMEALMSEKASLYQNLPRRRISAHRDFPARCGMKPLFACVRESQESAECAIDRRLSDAKSSGRNCLTPSERPNGIPMRGEVQNGDSSKGKFEGTAMHGTRSLQHAPAKETFDTKLKQRTQGSSQTQSGRTQATVKSIAKKHSFVAGSTSEFVHEVKVKENMGDKGDMRAIIARRKVKETLDLFDDICEKLFRAKRANPKEAGLRRIDCKAATMLKNQNKCANFGVPNVGVVPGVKVGDKFRFRSELAIIGLHRPYQGGIDFYKREWDGKVLALSIVASGGYDDYKDSSDVLIYSGQGGNPVRGAKEATDQKLERGNLGLRNSMLEKSPVRVIRGFDEMKGHDLLPGSMEATLTYDGLYDVERLWEEKGPYGTNVFKFLLRRQPGQPELAAKKS